MKRVLHFLAYGAAILTVLFAAALPIKGLPVLISGIGALDLKIAPWFSGGDVAFVLDRGSYQIKVHRPVYPALVGEGNKGFVQLVWGPRNALPAEVREPLDLDHDGSVDCEISFSLPEGEKAPLLTVVPRSAWVLPVQDSPTTSLEEVLIEKGKREIFVRVPVRRHQETGTAR